MFPEIQRDRAKMFPMFPLVPRNKCTFTFLINSAYDIEDKYYLTKRVAAESYLTVKKAAGTFKH